MSASWSAAGLAATGIVAFATAGAGASTQPAVAIVEATDATHVRCVVMNGTDEAYAFQAGRSLAPEFFVEVRVGSGWSAVVEPAPEQRLIRVMLFPNQSTEFEAHVGAVHGPFRIRVELQRDSDDSTVTVFSREMRVKGRGRRRHGSVPWVPSASMHPTLTIRTEPDYPEHAWNARIEGHVFVELVVDAYGDVADARALNGDASLGAEAVRTVREWKYTPARDESGRAVACTVIERVRFEIPKPWEDVG